MGTDILKTAEPLKCIVIDYFMATTNNIVIGNEVMYGTQRKVVDLLLLKEKSLCAIEIKGNNDNLKLLPAQIEEYLKIFDFIYVFVTKKHEDSVLKLLPHNIGLYVINEGKIKRIRAPKRIRKHDKVEMLYSINNSFLVKKGVKNKENSDMTRLSVVIKSQSWVHDLLFDFYSTKLADGFNSYIRERGSISHVDDLLLLNGRHTICH